jgi:hypothetical protein
MGMCSHEPNDPPATYIYTLRIQRFCVQIILMVFVILPLAFVVPRVVFQARFHVVSRVEVIATDIDLSSGGNSTNLDEYRILQFDEALDVLEAQNLCGSAGNSLNIERDTR